MAQENGATQTNNNNVNNNGGNNKPHNNKRYGYNKPRYNKHHDNRENGNKNSSPSAAKVNHQQEKQNYKKTEKADFVEKTENAERRFLQFLFG